MRKIYQDDQLWTGGKNRPRCRVTEKPHPSILVITDGRFIDPRYAEDGFSTLVHDKRDRMTKKQRAIAKLPHNPNARERRRHRLRDIEFLRRCWADDEARNAS